MVSEESRRRFADIARAAQRSGSPKCSRFLEPPECVDARWAAAQEGAKLALWGGYDDAERQVAGFYVGEEISRWEWPVACLQAQWNARFASAEHRDMLGALMGLGVERAMMGDIQLGEDCAYLFVLDEVADYIAANLESAGRAKLKLQRIDPSEAKIAPPKGRELRITLASLRLDALVAEGYDISRADAQELIRRGLVKRNHIPCEKGDCRVEEGDLISARGYGRMKLMADLGETKKGRVAARVFRYGES